MRPVLVLEGKKKGRKTKRSVLYTETRALHRLCQNLLLERKKNEAKKRKEGKRKCSKNWSEVFVRRRGAQTKRE